VPCRHTWRHGSVSWCEHVCVCVISYTVRTANSSVNFNKITPSPHLKEKAMKLLSAFQLSFYGFLEALDWPLSPGWGRPEGALSGSQEQCGGVGRGQQANSHFPCRGNARYGFTRQHKQDWGRGGGLPTFSCPHQSPEYQDASGKSQMGNTLM
jgi:hypothetical protein